MRRSHVLVSLLCMALLVAACGKSSKKASTTTTVASTATTAAGGATTTASVAEQTANPTLSVADNASLGKKIIVDAAGKSVYLYEPDGSSKTSTVPANIKANWPPVHPPGAGQTTSKDLDNAHLQVYMQPDGTSQLSYNGHLLYYFAGDAAAGDAKGNGLGSVWFALGPDGNKLS